MDKNAFVFSLMISFLSQVLGQKEVALTPKTLQAQVGKKVELTCRAAGYDPYIDSIMFYKLSLDDSSDEKILLSSHTHVTQKFANEMSLKTDSEPVGNKTFILFFLTIEAIKESNDGRYMCGIEQNNTLNPVDTMELVVLKPVSDINLQLGKHNFNDDSTQNVIQLQRQFKPLPITCSVGGSNPEPTVILAVDGKDVTVAVTKEFTPISRVAINGTPMNGIRSWTYIIRSSKFMKKEYVNKKITCSAFTKNSRQVPKVASVTVQVNEPPVIKCKNVRVPMGQSTTLTCFISHNYSPVGDIKWIDQLTQKVIRPGKSVPGYVAKSVHIGNNTVRTTLKIASLPRLENVYQIVVKHLNMQKEHAIRADLYKATTPTSSAMCPLPTIMPFILLASVVRFIC